MPHLLLDLILLQSRMHIYNPYLQQPLQDLNLHLLTRALAGRFILSLVIDEISTVASQYWEVCSQCPSHFVCDYFVQPVHTDYIR